MAIYGADATLNAVGGIYFLRLNSCRLSRDAIFDSSCFAGRGLFCVFFFGNLSPLPSLLSHIIRADKSQFLDAVLPIKLFRFSFQLFSRKRFSFSPLYINTKVNLIIYARVTGKLRRQRRARKHKSLVAISIERSVY